MKESREKYFKLYKKDGNLILDNGYIELKISNNICIQLENVLLFKDHIEADQKSFIPRPPGEMAYETFSFKDLKNYGKENPTKFDEYNQIIVFNNQIYIIK